MSDELTRAPDPDRDPTLTIILRVIQGALKQGRCTGEFQVGHVLDTGGANQILSRLVDVTLPLDRQFQRAMEIATEFNDATLTHVRGGFRTVQKYAVNGFKKNGDPIESMVFPQHPPNEGDLGGMSTTPTDKGTLMLMQEMTLAHAGHGYRARSDEVDRLERMLTLSEARADRANARAEKLEDKRAEVSAKYEEILQKQWERDREKAAGEATSRQAEKLMTAAMFLGKVACDRWGIEVPEGAFQALMMSDASDPKTSPLAELKTKVVLEKMTALLQSLTAEQQMTIIGCLDENQAKAFAEGFQMMLAAAKPPAPLPGKANETVKSVTMSTPTPVKPAPRGIL